MQGWLLQLHPHLNLLFWSVQMIDRSWRMRVDYHKLNQMVGESIYNLFQICFFFFLLDLPLGFQYKASNLVNTLVKTARSSFLSAGYQQYTLSYNCISNLSLYHNLFFSQEHPYLSILKDILLLHYVDDIMSLDLLSRKYILPQTYMCQNVGSISHKHAGAC